MREMVPRVDWGRGRGGGGGGLTDMIKPAQPAVAAHRLLVLSEVDAQIAPLQRDVVHCAASKRDGVCRVGHRERYAHGQ